MSKLLHITFVLGASGSGKDFLVNSMVDKNPHIGKLISYTDRIPRSGEDEGKAYKFVSSEMLKSMIESNKMLEHVKHGTCSYGYSLNDFKQIADECSWIFIISNNESIKAFSEELYSNKIFKDYKLTYDLVILDISLEERIDNLNGKYSSEEITERLYRDKDMIQCFIYKYKFLNIEFKRNCSLRMLNNKQEVNQYLDADGLSDIGEFKFTKDFL